MVIGLIIGLIIGICIGFGLRSLMQVFYNRKLQAIKKEWIRKNAKETPTTE